MIFPRIDPDVFSFQLNQHIRDRHNPELPFGCDKCFYRANTEMAIKLHMNAWHEEKKYRCKKCHKG